MNDKVIVEEKSKKLLKFDPETKLVKTYESKTIEFKQNLNFNHCVLDCYG